MSSSGNSLSEEQRKKIEENRKKALERRALLDSQRQPPARGHVQGGYGRSGPVPNAIRPFPTSNTSKPFNQGISKKFSQAPKPINELNQNRKQLKSASFPGEFPKTKLDHPSRNVCSTDGSFKKIGSAFSSRTDFSNKPKTTSTGGLQNFFSGSANKQGSSKSSSSSFSSDTLNQSEKKHLSPVKGQPGILGGRGVVKGICVLVSSTQFAVKIGFNAQLIALFKTIPSRAYDASTTTWSFGLEDYKALISATKDVANVFVEPLPRAVLSLCTKSTPGTLKSMSSKEINLNSVDTKLVSALMPFQKEGVSFCIRRDGRTIIADEMGLGKTVQAICVASYYRKEWPLLVVAPSSVRLTWQQAFIRWLPSVDPQYINVILTGKDSPTAGLINIISYDLLSKFISQLKERRFRVIIADESHFIKNSKAARTKVFLPLLKAATRVLLLSGTPALSRPEELYTQICAVNPRLFPSFHEFGLRYCAGVENRWGWDYSGASNMEELQLILEKDIMIRRLKKEVLPQLPSKRRQMVVLDPSLIKTKPLTKAAKEVEQAKKKDQHGALLNYFCETSGSKISAVKNYVLDLVEGGHKFLVFGHHQNMLNAISESLDLKKYKYIRIDGRTASSKRQMLCDQFQQDENIVVAVLSITAANTGLTLTAGTTVVFAELFWNPGALVQAEDRVYRIGQKNSVNIHYLVAKGTADDYLWPLIQGKLEVLSKAGLSKDDFSEADTTTFQDPKQRTLFSCFESLIEEFDEPIPNSLVDEPEATTSAQQETNSASTTTDDKGANSQTNAISNTVENSTSKENGEEQSRTEEFDWFDDLDDDNLGDEDLLGDLSEIATGKSACTSKRSGKRSEAQHERRRERTKGFPTRDERRENCYHGEPSSKRSKT